MLVLVLGVKEGAFDLPQDLWRCLSITIVDHLQPFVVPPSPKSCLPTTAIGSTFVSNLDHCLNFYCVGQKSNLPFAHVVNIKQVSFLHAINPCSSSSLSYIYVRTMHLNALRHRPKLDFFNTDWHTSIFFFFYIYIYSCTFPWRKSFLIPSWLLLYLFAILKPYICLASTRVGLGWFVLERSVFTGSSFPAPIHCGPHTFDMQTQGTECTIATPSPCSVHALLCIYLVSEDSFTTVGLFVKNTGASYFKWAPFSIDGIFRAICKAQGPSNCKKVKTWTYQWATSIKTRFSNVITIDKDIQKRKSMKR